MQQETIRCTFKAKDEAETSIRDFIRSCLGREKLRKSSLGAMETAYGHLHGSIDLDRLPSIVVEVSEAADALLGGKEGGYVLQAFKNIAEFLDTIVSYDHEEVREHRRATLERLRLLLRDGAQDHFLKHPYENTAHLLVLLGGPKHLGRTLSLGTMCNMQWLLSGWTPLHLAAQEGKKEMVEILLKYGARKNVKDIHGRFPVKYARLLGKYELVEVLSPELVVEGPVAASRLQSADETHQNG
ncbi:hypothetical protein NUW58_g6636 [Xylaria curta]|uniref:Uncharacterized protein n=1 Tax=Xylaria curta TaxID=42375 RepID=A0ACC1NRV3_9PEZI|nr:hypothetical protein NUW58_g6636 [Xylaria curta]